MNEILDQAISKNGDSDEEKKKRKDLIADVLFLKLETLGLFPETCGKPFADWYEAFRKLDLRLDTAARQASEFPDGAWKLLGLLIEVENEKDRLEDLARSAPEPCNIVLGDAIAEFTKELERLFDLLNDFFSNRASDPLFRPVPDKNVPELQKALPAGISKLKRLKRDSMKHLNTSWDAGELDFEEWYWLWEGFDGWLERAFDLSDLFAPDFSQHWLFKALKEKAEMEKILQVKSETQGQPKFGSLDPSSGPAGGGTRVVIAGENIGGVSSVTVASAPVDFGSFEDVLMFFTPPAETEGVAEINIITVDGAAHTFTFTYQGQGTSRGEGTSRGAIVEPEAVWADSFNGSDIDETRWRSGTGGFGSTITQADGRLEIRHQARSSGSTFWAETVSVCQITGDFDVEVDYELLGWPAQNGVRVGLNSVASDGSEIAVERVSFGGKEFTTQEEYLVDWGGFFDTVSAGDNLSGKLRMSREDNRVSGFYFDDGDWVLIDGRFMGTGDVSLKLGSWSHDNKFADQEVVVGFDNFLVRQGELKCPG